MNQTFYIFSFAGIKNNLLSISETHTVCAFLYVELWVCVCVCVCACLHVHIKMYLHANMLQHQFLTFAAWKSNMRQLLVNKFFLSRMPLSKRAKSPLHSSLSLPRLPTAIHLLTVPCNCGHNNSKGETTAKKMGAAKVFSVMRRAGIKLLEKSPWKPVKADSKRMEGMVAWWPVA